MQWPWPSEEEIIAAATRIDRELTRLPRQAMAQQWTRSEWRYQRSHLAELTGHFETAARHALGAARLQDPAPSLYAPGDFEPTPPPT
jgi:hypothetical protein